MSSSAEENTFMVVNRVHFVVGFCASVKQCIFVELGGFPTVPPVKHKKSDPVKVHTSEYQELHETNI